MFDLLLSLFDLHQAKLSLDAAHREFLRRALPWTPVSSVMVPSVCRWTIKIV